LRACSLRPVLLAWRQIVERLGGVEDEELPQRRALNALIELARPLSPPYTFGFLVGKRPPHTASV